MSAEIYKSLQGNFYLAMEKSILHNFPTWIEENKASFLPPVCNKMMHGEGQMKVFLVGGPNIRKDYHIEEGEEFFYMVKGDMCLKILERNKHIDVIIKDGEVFLLPARIPHSPQRKAGTVGLVIERERAAYETDGLRYFVEQDGKPASEVLYEKWFHCDNLGPQLAAIINGYFETEQSKTGIPKPGTILDYDKAPVKIDLTTPINPPFSLSDWLDKNTGSCLTLFGEGNKSSVLVYGAGEHSVLTETAEVFIWILRGVATVKADKEYIMSAEIYKSLQGNYRESGSPTSYMLDYIPLFTAYLILFLYIYFSVRKINLVKSKWGLALSAVVTVVASLLMSISICAVFGVTPSVNSGEIFPYLVVIIGLENVLVLTGSVVNTKPSLEVKYRIAEGLRKEGWNITKHLATELVILLLGFFTFVPAIQEFCLFATIGLLVDFYLQMVFFATTLSIDIKRLELSDLDHHPGMVEKTDAKSSGGESIMVASFFRTIPKRIKVMNFVAQFRVVQRLIMVCTLIWIGVVLYKTGILTSLAVKLSQYEEPKKPSLILPESYDSSINSSNLPMRTIEMLNNETMQPYIAMVLFSDEASRVETWKKLSFLHWPGVFALYNKPVVATYLSFLPSLKLSMVISPEEALRIQNGNDDLSENTLELDEKIEKEHTLFYHIINGSQFRSLTGTEKILIGVAAILIMVIFTWLLSVLYSVMCGKNYDRWRSGGRHQRKLERYSKVLNDPIRFHMEGHDQPIECLASEGSMIVSTCLAGDIMVWNGESGEVIAQIQRSGFGSSQNLDDDYKMRQLSHTDGRCSHGHTQDIAKFDLAPFVDTRFNFSERKSFAECLEKIEMERTNQSPSLHPSADRSNQNSQLSSHSSDPAHSHSSASAFEEMESGSRSPHWSSSDLHAHENSVFREPLSRPNIWCLDVYDGLIVVGCSNGDLEFWDSSIGVKKCSYLSSGLSSGITSVKSVGTRVVAGRANGYLDFFEISYQPRQTPGHIETVNVVKLHRRVRSLGNIPTWRNMDTNCTHLQGFKAHQSAISLIAISGGRVLSGSEDTLVKVYRLETCTLLYNLNGHDAPITVLRCDKLGNAITASEDGLIRLWDLFSGTCIHVFKGLSSPILHVETTAHHVAASSTDSLICIWDKSSGRLLHTIQSTCSNHTESGALTTLAGSLLVSGGRDFLHLWDLSSGIQVMRCALAVDNSVNEPVMLNNYVSRLCVVNQQTVVSSVGSELYAVNFPNLVNAKYE